VLGKRRAEAAGRQQIDAGGGGPRDGVGIPVAGGQESGGQVARQLLRDDVVLVGCLARAKRWWIDRTTARPSGGGSSSSPVRWSGRSGARERNWAGSGARVGGGGASRALDRGWEAAEAAVDGEPRLRRGSGEVESTGKRKAVEMHVCERKSESVGSSRTCSRSRRR
jgi:hypothetical protein